MLDIIILGMISMMVAVFAYVGMMAWGPTRPLTVNIFSGTIIMVVIFGLVFWGLLSLFGA